MAKRTLVIDLDRCSGCDSCVVACKFENGIGLGNYWNTVEIVGPAGTHPNIEMYWLPMQCQQCENSPCVAACPTGAAYRDPDNNVVLINKETCTGCKSCLPACPWSDPEGNKKPSVRWFNEDAGVMEKCTLCNHLTAKSDGVENPKDTSDPGHAVPPCVHNCSCKARHYGDLEDPNSDASMTIAQAEKDGRKVCQLEFEGVVTTVRYILSENIAAWKGLEGSANPLH